MYDYVTKYKPEYIWSDGDVGPPEYWTSQELLAWLYNDRWGDNIFSFNHLFYCSLFSEL